MSWQQRDLLATDGSVSISPQGFITTTGDYITLAPDTQRRTLVYFFAPWCQVCRYSINNLDTLDPSRVKVVRIALDYGAVEDVEKFAAELGIEDQILLGGPQHKARFNIKAYPSYYLLDQDFKVIAKDMGYSTSIGLKLRSMM